METIYNKIKNAVVAAKIEHIVYKESYPCDYVELDYSIDEILDNEGIDTLTPLVNALEVITKTIKEEATIEDDVVVEFFHNPFDERWHIAISDGR